MEHTDGRTWNVDELGAVVEGRCVACDPTGGDGRPRELTHVARNRHTGRAHVVCAECAGTILECPGLARFMFRDRA